MQWSSTQSIMDYTTVPVGLRDRLVGIDYCERLISVSRASAL
jgi:hypothetical protein